MTTRLQLGLVGVTTVALLGASASLVGAPAPFGPTTTLDPTSPRSPGVSIADDGTAVAAWTVTAGTSTVIRSATRSPGGTFGPVVDVASSLSSSLPLSRPRVGLDGAGGGALIWETREESNVGPKTVTAALRSGGAFGTPARISPPGVTTEGAELGVGRDGTAVASWVRLASVETQFTSPDRVAVQVAVKEPGAPAFGAPQDLEPEISGVLSPSVAVSPSGAAAVAYVRPQLQQDGTTRSVVAVAYRAPGAGFGTPVVVSGDEPDVVLPRVTIDASGRATVVWTVSSSSSTYGSVARVATVDSSGVPTGPATNLSVVAPAFAVTSARVATNQSGDTAVVWSRRPTPGLLQTVVEAAVRPAGATGFGAPITLTSDTLDSKEPVAKVSDDGVVLAQWQQRTGSDPEQLMSATLSVGATGFGPASSLGRSRNVAMDPAELALGRDGSAVRVFSNVIPNGTGTLTTLGVAVTQNAPAFVSAPVITGTPAVRSVLTCTTPGLVGASGVSYEWLRGTRLVGTASTYTVVKGDRGKVLTCRVTATNPNGSAVGTSAGLHVP
jgi:hypothetical protein